MLSFASLPMPSGGRAEPIGRPAPIDSRARRCAHEAERHVAAFDRGAPDVARAAHGALAAAGDPPLAVALQRVGAGSSWEPALAVARLTVALTGTRWRGGPVARVGDGEAPCTTLDDPLTVDDQVPRFAVLAVPAGIALRWERGAPTRLLSLYVDPGADSALSAAFASLRLVRRLPRAGALVEQLVAELDRPVGAPGGPGGGAARRADPLAVGALARLLLVRFARDHPRADAAPDALTPTQLQRVQDLIGTRLGHPLPVATLAAAAGLPAARFARAFARETGVTPHQFVIHQRLRHALTLLRSSREPLADVALASGFASQQHLARWMRRCLDVTPGQWRLGGRAGLGSNADEG